MMRPSTFFFLTRRGVRNLGKHWAMTIACIASLSVCMTLNIFASLAEVNVGSMVAYLGSQNETVVYLDPECDDATAAQVGETLSAMPGVSGVQYVSKQDVLDTYRGYMQDYSSLWDEFENDNPFKANYRVTLSDLTQMERMSVKMQAIPGVVSVTAPVEMTNVFVEIQKAVTKGGRMIVMVLMVVSIITVGSTIRLSVFARRREIEIMKYVGATNRMVTLPFFVEGLTMGLISGILTAAVSLGCYTYVVNAAGGLGGIWQMLMGRALVPVTNVLPTIVVTSLLSGAIVGGVGKPGCSGDLVHGWLAPQLLFQRFPRLHGAVGGVPQGAAYPQGVVVPQKPPNLPDDHRHAVGRKPHRLRGVKVVDGFDQPDAPHLKQIVQIFAPLGKPLHHAEHQPQVALHHPRPGSFVPGVGKGEQLTLFRFGQHRQLPRVYTA